MNFDIKYVTYLQIFNFIKIKQVLMIFLGTQSYGSLTEPLNQPGCKLEITSKVADIWDPQTRERREFSLGMKKAIIKCAQTMKSVLCGVHYHTYGSRRPRSNKNATDLNQTLTQRF